MTLFSRYFIVPQQILKTVAHLGPIFKVVIQFKSTIYSIGQNILDTFFLLVVLQKRKLVEVFYILKSVFRKNHYLYSVRFSYSMLSTSVKTTIFSIRKEMKTNCINSYNMCRTYTYLIPFIETIIRIRILFDRAKIWFYEKFRSQKVSSFFEDRKHVY